MVYGRQYGFHLASLFAIQLVVLTWFSRVWIPLSRLSIFLSLVVFLVWSEEEVWWHIIGLVGLGIAMDFFSFFPWGHFFLLVSIAFLLSYLWRALFSQNMVATIFLFLFFPWIEFSLETLFSHLSQGVCLPLWTIVAVKCASIPVNISLFFLWFWGGSKDDMGRKN